MHSVIDSTLKFMLNHKMKSDLDYLPDYKTRSLIFKRINAGRLKKIEQVT